MPSCTTSLSQAISAVPGLELVAVAFAIMYLLLAMRQSLWCWYAALLSTSIYIYLYWDVSLYMESVLNVYYVVMAVYGWWQWHGGSFENSATITRFNKQQHLIAIGLIISASLVSGYLLQQNTDARLPYLDSLTTWGAVITTYMVAKKVLDNWIYWLAINSVGIYLNIDRCMLPTALLLACYHVICIYGYLNWRKDYVATTTSQ